MGWVCDVEPANWNRKVALVVDLALVLVGTQILSPLFNFETAKTCKLRQCSFRIKWD